MMSEDDAGPSPVIAVSDVDGELMRELLLTEIATMRSRQLVGKKVDVDALERLLELTKDFPALSKAVDDLQERRHAEPAAEATPSPETVVAIRALKAVLGKK